MARKRTIDPGYWTNDKPAELSRDHRLLFLGLISNADDEGRLHGSARRIRITVFPYDDDIEDATVERWLRDLAAVRLIQRWESDAETYIELPGWEKHQKIKYASQSKLPAYNGEPLLLPQSSPSLPPGLGEPFPKTSPGLDQSSPRTGEVLPQSSPRTSPQEERRGEEGREVKRRGVKKEVVGSVGGGGLGEEGEKSPAVPAPDPLRLAIPTEWLATIPDPDSFIRSAHEAYPELDLAAEIKKAKAWAAADPRRKKKRWAPLLMNWFARAADPRELPTSHKTDQQRGWARPSKPEDFKGGDRTLEL